MAEPAIAPRLRTLPTTPADSLAWMRGDALVRLVPFALAVAAVEAVWRPPWLGLSAGRAGMQLLFGASLGTVMFVLALRLQLELSRRRGSIRVPSGGADAALQALYYALNAPLEEAFFRGLLQGGLGALAGPALGFALGTGAYVLYNRLGGWSWPDTAATALAGVPLGLAFWLLPGPASLLGVSLAHAGATSGFLGPGPYLLRRFGRLPG